MTLSKTKVDCHCCAGVDASTPLQLHNPPGLDSINYRVGEYSDFFASMQSRLSSVDYPALANLSTRESSDFSIALCDAFACSLDVLSFYTERYAQEHYLRTADERLSVAEMARLIGYQLAPGVAASTHLAFTLQSIPGAPADPIKIPVGTRVQSVPGQDEKAQTFETVAVVSARAEWNAIPVQTTVAWLPQSGDTELWIAGIDAQIEPGDAILIVGADRLQNAGSEHWDVRVVAKVHTDRDNNRTQLTWNHPLGSHLPHMTPASRGVEVHVFRQRTNLFGHNAPDPNLMSQGDGSSGSNIGERIDTSNTLWQWKNFTINGSTIDLATDNKKITTDSWVALVSNDASQGSAELPGYTELYRADKVQQRSRSDFGLSSKITRITPDTTENLTSANYSLRRTLVLAQSEALQSHPVPLFHPLYGDSVTCGQRIDGLQPGQALALSGKRQRLVIDSGVTGLALISADGSTRILNEHDPLLMAAPAVRKIGSSETVLDAVAFHALLGSSARLLLTVIDRDGQQGVLDCLARQIRLVPAKEDDPLISEILFIDNGDDAVITNRDHTSIKLTSALQHVYDRASAHINANVAPATQGETVEAILGSGDESSANQRFELNQSPLTFISANTPSGRASTLALRVNDVLWQEVPTLYQASANARQFTTRRSDAGVTSIQFGDGIEGARLPSGESNIRVLYRKGLGVAGNVKAGALSTLLSRPLGVSEVSNPQAASGGEDPESLDRARDNAPLTVLTLDRAVSIEDYANFARAFAGIDKAHALWVPAGPGRGVFLTVAGIDGAEVASDSKTYNSLLESLTTYGDPLVPLRMVNYIDARFRCGLSVKVLAAYELDSVLNAVETTLRSHFSFANRHFGQPVSIDEVAATAQGVAGVEAVHVTRLHRSDAAQTITPRLFATLPTASLTLIPTAAELLTLDDAALELEVLP